MIDQPTTAAEDPAVTGSPLPLARSLMARLTAGNMDSPALLVELVSVVAELERRQLMIERSIDRTIDWVYTEILPTATDWAIRASLLAGNETLKAYNRNVEAALREVVAGTGPTMVNLNIEPVLQLPDRQTVTKVRRDQRGLIAETTAVETTIDE